MPWREAQATDARGSTFFKEKNNNTNNNANNTIMQHKKKPRWTVARSLPALYLSLDSAEGPHCLAKDGLSKSL